jgi:hypothetical protein
LGPLPAEWDGDTVENSKPLHHGSAMKRAIGRLECKKAGMDCAGSVKKLIIFKFLPRLAPR